MPTHHHADQGQSHDSSLSKSTDQHELPTSNKTQKYVSTACDACKKARRKCDGREPCQACLHARRECAFNQINDGRRGRKRTLDELHAKLEAYDTVIASLRSSDHKSSEELLHAIRSKISMNELAERARKTLQENENSNSSGSSRREVMSIAALTIEPPIRVPAKPWTSVTDDDEAVSHLISVFFAWHYSIYPTVIERIFIREMKSGLLSSQYCSPFLVNAILAAACVYTDHPCAFSIPGDPNSRGIHFQNEAVKLFALEEGRTSLATLQGMPALCFGMVVLGKDRVSHLYTGNMISLTVDLNAKVRKTLKQNGDAVFDDDYQKSLALAIWGCFAWTVETAMAWRKPYELQLPSVKPPFSESDLQTLLIWQPYPKITPAAEVALYGVINERLSLYTIAADLLPLVLSNDTDRTWSEPEITLRDKEKLARLRDVSQRLSSWYSRLPPYARMGSPEETNVSGPLLDLHLCYHYHQITVHSQTMHNLQILAEDQRKAAEQLVDNCRMTAQRIEQLQQCFGLAYCPCSVGHATILAVLSLIGFLQHDGASDTFHALVQALSASSKRWNIARGAMKMIWITLQERGMFPYLNEATLSLLKLGAVDTWTSDDYKLFEDCSYPNYTVVHEKGRELADMGDLLMQYYEIELERNG